MHHDIMFNIETKKTSKTTNHNMQTQGQSECENIIPTETTEEAKSVEERKTNKAVGTVCATRATAAAAAIVAGTAQP